MTTKTSTQSQAPKDNRKPAAFSASQKKPKTPKTPKSTAKSQSGQNHNPKGASKRLPVVATTITLPRYDDRPQTMLEVCERIAEGETLQNICRNNEHLPSLSTVMKWIAEDENISEMYARARQKQADYYADEIIDIADMSTAETWGVDRLRIDARKWHASKCAPKKYGDRVELEHGGRVGMDIKVIPIKFLEPDPMLPEK